MQVLHLSIHRKYALEKLYNLNVNHMVLTFLKEIQHKIFSMDVVASKITNESCLLLTPFQFKLKKIHKNNFLKIIILISNTPKYFLGFVLLKTLFNYLINKSILITLNSKNFIKKKTSN